MKAQLALAAVLAGACVFPANAETRKDFRTSDAPPMPSRGVCAHRGNGGGKPENTVVAFTNAVALGAAMVEFDVKRCKTGELVIMHLLLQVRRSGKGEGASRPRRRLRPHRPHRGDPPRLVRHHEFGAGPGNPDNAPALRKALAAVRPTTVPGGARLPRR